MGTARIGRSKRCSECAIRRCIQRGHVSNAMLQSHGRCATPACGNFGLLAAANYVSLDICEVPLPAVHRLKPTHAQLEHSLFRRTQFDDV